VLVPHLGHTRPIAVVIGSVVTDDVCAPAVVDTRPIAVVIGSVVTDDVCAPGSHAWMPSSHVCSKFSEFPHFLNQEPPGAQQLRLPDFVLVPHLGHTRPIAVVIGSVVTDDVCAPAVVDTRPIAVVIGSVVTDDVCAPAVVDTRPVVVVMDSAVSSHACLPSNHVCSKFESPGSPHFLNQEPPRAQQVGLPDLVATHLEHVAAAAPSIDDIDFGGIGEQYFSPSLHV